MLKQVQGIGQLGTFAAFRNIRNDGVIYVGGTRDILGQIGVPVLACFGVVSSRRVAHGPGRARVLLSLVSRRGKQVAEISALRDEGAEGRSMSRTNQILRRI